ncbi:hypothetical protein J4447_00120 [Candidatus Pacearchaeota archaeon]|nr:hypothetical protein [Candidatus Pacearchaeota archaeon]
MVYQKDKRGVQMVSQQITVMVIVLVSLGIILMLYFLIDFEGQSDWEACHNSIILRGTARYGDLFKGGPEAIPLKCRTEKYCIAGKETSDKVCPNIEYTNDNPVRTESIAGNSKSMRDNYLDFMAEKLYECHALVGEGEVNFMPPKFYEQKYCLICSRFDIEPSLKENLGDITYRELYERMASKKTKSGKSYLEYIYKMKDPVQGLKDTVQSLKESEFSDKFVGIEWDTWKLPISEQNAIIVATVKGGEGTEIVTSIGAGVAVVGLLVAGAFSGGGAWAAIPAVVGAVFKGSTVAGIVYAYGSADGEFSYVPPGIQPYDAETLKNALGCSSFETAP